MIDIVREIGTVQREVGSGRLAAGEDVGCCCAGPTRHPSTTSGMR